MMAFVGVVILLIGNVLFTVISKFALIPYIEAPEKKLTDMIKEIRE